MCLVGNNTNPCRFFDRIFIEMKKPPSSIKRSSVDL
jgi:hypothetical protein